MRINDDLKRRPNRGPKRPGRKKGVKLYDDRAATAEARRLLAGPNPPSIRQAAWKVEPRADRGQRPTANVARVYKILSGV